MGSLLALFILFPLLDQYSKFLYWHPTMNGVGICVLGFILVVVIVGVIFSWCGACRSIRKREGRGGAGTFQRLERERFIHQKEGRLSIRIVGRALSGIRSVGVSSYYHDSGVSTCLDSVLLSDQPLVRLQTVRKEQF